MYDSLKSCIQFNFIMCNFVMRKNTENVDLFFLYIYEYIKKSQFKIFFKKMYSKCIRRRFENGYIYMKMELG